MKCEACGEEVTAITQEIVCFTWPIDADGNIDWSSENIIDTEYIDVQLTFCECDCGSDKDCPYEYDKNEDIVQLRATIKEQ